MNDLYPNYKRSGNLDKLKADPSVPDEAINVDYMMDNVWIVGDPEECVDKICKLYEQVGGFGTLLLHVRDMEDTSLEMQSMTRLAEKVMPKIEGLGANGISPERPA